MRSLIGTIIWDWSEFFRIPLGNYAPIIMGWMLDSKPEKQDEKET